MRCDGSRTPKSTTEPAKIWMNVDQADYEILEHFPKSHIQRSFSTFFWNIQWMNLALGGLKGKFEWLCTLQVRRMPSDTEIDFEWQPPVTWRSFNDTHSTAERSRRPELIPAGKVFIAPHDPIHWAGFQRSNRSARRYLHSPQLSLSGGPFHLRQFRDLSESAVSPAAFVS